MTEIGFSFPHFLVLVLGAVRSVAGTKGGDAQSNPSVKTVSDTVALDSTGVLDDEDRN